MTVISDGEIKTEDVETEDCKPEDIEMEGRHGVDAVAGDIIDSWQSS